MPLQTTSALISLSIESSYYFDLCAEHYVSRKTGRVASQNVDRGAFATFTVQSYGAWRGGSALLI